MGEFVENVVFIPGLNNTKIAWDEVINNLPESVNATAVTVPAISDIDELAKELLKELPEKFHLVGHSFGGFVSLAILEEAPERVTGLALVGTNANADSEAGKEKRKQSIAKASSGQYEEMVSAGASRTFHPTNVGNEKLQKIRSEMLEGYGAERYIAHSTATMNRPDRNHLFKKVDIPYLFVASEDDLVVPLESTKAMLEFAPNAAFETVENSGHLIPIEQPEALAEKLKPWLKSK